MDFLTGVWAWLEAQGLAGDITQWITGVVLGVPFLGGLVGGIIGIFKPSAGKVLGEKCGLPISTFMRNIPIVGKFWEFFEDRIFKFFIDFFTGALKTANLDDKK